VAPTSEGSAAQSKFQNQELERPNNAI
jgi:hypothetical protein